MKMKKIMVVDDDVSLTRLLKASLEKHGCYKVTVENRSTRAVEAIRKTAPDVIVLDVIMPDKDGGDIAQAIREDRRLKKIPIIFLTSIISKQERAEHEGMMGGDRFLAKPIGVNELVAEIETVLDNC